MRWQTGRYTWEGPGVIIEGQLDLAPPTIDPNYEAVEEGGAVDDEVAREVVVEEVKIAKVAESKDDVARGPCLLPQPTVLLTVDRPQVAVNSHTRASSHRKSTRACTTRVVESRHLLLRCEL